MSDLSRFDAIARQVLTLPDPRAHTLSLRASALIFNDPRSLELQESMEKVAPSGASVLIIGETGTGKELIARRLHELSGRKGPFIAVNCGALSESLAESELFGHEKGAFTGAVNSRAGWFEAADGGTLFLDEVGDLPLSLQVKLLRVLQEREVVRLGARRSVPIDVRLVAATNVQLERAVAGGHFRMDLYYRLNVVKLALPPLRERPGDILPLTEHFLKMYSERLHLRRIRLTPEAEQAMLAYAWPGNIRELENVVHYALLVCDNRSVTPENLRLPSQTVHFSPPPETRRVQPSARDGEQLLTEALRQLYEEQADELFDRVQKLLIEQAYEFCDHNQVRTAELLGVSRNIVRTLLQRYGWLPPRRRENAGVSASR